MKHIKWILRVAVIIIIVFPRQCECLTQSSKKQEQTLIPMPTELFIIKNWKNEWNDEKIF